MQCDASVRREVLWNRRLTVLLPAAEDIDAAATERRLTADEVRAKWRSEQVANLTTMLSELNSTWRCKQINNAKLAYSTDNDEPANGFELDPSVFLCFGNTNSQEEDYWPAESDSDISGMETLRGSCRSCRSERPTPIPRMSGFLCKRSKFTSPRRLFNAWQERWFVLLPHRCGALVQYYKHDSYDAPARSLVIGAGSRGSREASLDSTGRYCIAFCEHESGRRVVLAASSEAQAESWVSCINTLIAESLPFSRASSM
jgi:hypothetical protein